MRIRTTHSHVEEEKREEEDVGRRHCSSHRVPQRHRQPSVGHHGGPRREGGVNSVNTYIQRDHAS